MEKERYANIIIISIISLISLIFACFHVIYPYWGIDYITITLLLIAFFPWFAPFFEVIEFDNGFFKFIFRKKDLTALTQNLLKSNLAPELNQEDKSGLSEKLYLFQKFDNPNKALVLLRDEIEAKLKDVAECKQIETDGMSVDQIIKLLSNKGIMSQKEEVTLIKLMNVLNRAAHAIKIEDGSIDWANDLGPRILKGLDQKCQIYPVIIERTQIK